MACERCKDTGTYISDPGALTHCSCEIGRALHTEHAIIKFRQAMHESYSTPLEEVVAVHDAATELLSKLEDE
jgi:hypothetical protein